MNWQRFAGWLPALILPAATADQLFTLLRAESVEGVSALTWFLFLLANLGALTLADPAHRIGRIQKGLAFGLTAALDLAILATIGMKGSG